ncbi:MAG: prepilin-type N-terminal cleavage/methylation domain-containing protein [Solirubrobacterales bacterium]
MIRSKSIGKRGFSLLEVVIVVAIIAILAAIGIPRMSRGSKGANDSAVSGDLAVLRNAIDLYSAEHGGTFPTTAGIVDQLTKYTDISGGVSAAKTTTHIYGPYVRSIPVLPVGSRKGSSGIATSDSNSVGWIYVEASGKINANTGTSTDDNGTLYTAY